MKRHSLAQFVFKSDCFLRKKILQFLNSFLFNFKYQTKNHLNDHEKLWKII